MSEPPAAEAPPASEADTELDQLLLEMGVSEDAARAWGGTGPVAADAAAAGAVTAPEPPAAPAQQVQLAGGAVSDPASASSGGSNVVVGAAALEAVISELLCPITHELMRDPVLAADGCTYEHTAIEAWIVRQRERGRAPTSPMTGELLEDLRLVPNHSHRIMAASAAAAGLLH